MNINSKYIEGLYGETLKERIKEIMKGQLTETDDPSAYDESRFKTDFVNGKRRKTKKSKYTEKFNELYPDAKSFEDIENETGIPSDILEKVYDKGLAAWRTGHRPGATQEQWGWARVYPFVVKGCTYYNPDHMLAHEAMERSPKAREHWDSLESMCGGSIDENIVFVKGPWPKKYTAIIKDGDKIKKINFGDVRYQQYEDKIGMYSDLDHLDESRRRNYRARHKAILSKDGTPSYKKKYTPAWFSYNYLW